MRPMQARTIAWLLAAFTLAACDGVGRSLVDIEKSLPSPGLKLECRKPPICAAYAPIELPVNIPGKLVLPVSLVGCEGRVEVCAPDIAADEDAGTDDCGEPRDLSELEMLAGQDVACRELSFAIPDDGAATWSVPRLRLSRVNLSIEAKRAVTIELPEALIADAFIQLRGPITLAISNARGVTDARVRSGLSASGAPIVMLRESKAERLAMAGRDGGTFEGEVRIVRSELVDSQLNARSIELESVAVTKSQIEAERFDATDVRFDIARLFFTRARISATDLNIVEIARCGALSLLQSAAATSSFAACSDEPARMYGSKLHEVWVNGAIEADKTVFDVARFGVADSVEILGWDANINVSMFCGADDRLQLSGGLVECTACDGDSLAEDESVCNMPMGFRSQRNSCMNLIRAPMCWPPLPVRMRPEVLK